MKMRTASKTISYDFWAVNTSYNVQDMLIGSANYPHAICPDDFCDSFYTDRLEGEIRTAFWNLNKEMMDRNIDVWAHGCGHDKLLEWAKAAYQIVNPGNTQEITGCRVVRYSDMGGFGIWRLDVVGVKPENKDKVIWHDRPSNFPIRITSDGYYTHEEYLQPGASARRLRKRSGLC